MIKSIRILNEDPYGDMRKMALRTVGKVPKSNDGFNKEWLQKSIISRHSHIRCVFFIIDFETTKPVRDQLLRSRHGMVEPWVQSQRPDRNEGKPRDPDALSSYYMMFNLEGLVKMCADRLCKATEKNTRAEINGLKDLMTSHEDEFIRAVGEMLVPKCCWYGTCNEFRPLDCFEMSRHGDDPIRKRINEFNG